MGNPTYAYAGVHAVRCSALRCGLVGPRGRGTVVCWRMLRYGGLQCLGLLSVGFQGALQ